MRVLLVEDEPDLGAAIKRALNIEKYVVDLVVNGTDAWGYLNNHETQYTLAIFDWLLPGLSGLELLRQLRYRNNPLPILMLTAKDRLEDRVMGLDTGADDYLVKPFRMAELLARVRALHRRTPLLQPQQIQVGELILDYGNRTVYRLAANGEKLDIPLTNKEFQLLEYFMKHPNQVMTTNQIRNQLWEVSAEPISNVVAAQMRLLRRKLESINSSIPIETVHGLGYRLNLKKS
ncbi:response regulator transcription factor [Moorena producens JHB]|uniref:Response regulator transcription factor n=1 Tax=Moorena producens (strain JHB) TaxID=1454205 RepID=A0A1D9FU35_MOOP1|nr:two-component system response regulator RppA [Moorena producens]AOY78803.1 response regulator transcription factor [Moorena producens JHB]